MSISNLTLLKPSLGRIVLEPLAEEDRTESGLFLVAETREKPIHVARVVATCESYQSAFDDEDELAPSGPRFKLNQIVVIGKYSGVDIKLGRGAKQKHYLILNESEILATLEEEPDEKEPGLGSPGSA